MFDSLDHANKSQWTNST